MGRQSLPCRKGPGRALAHQRRAPPFVPQTSSPPGRRPRAADRARADPGEPRGGGSMTRLRVKMWRDLWRMKWRALAIILTLASGVAVYAGFYMGVTSLLWTRDSIYRELHFADLEVRFLPDDDRNLPDLSGLEGVTRIERRLVFPGIVRPSGRAP